jgi:cell division protein FtsL
MVMALVLMLCAAISAVAVLWSTHRHRQLVAWDRELAAAFLSGERPEVPRHRAL